MRRFLNEVLRGVLHLLVRITDPTVKPIAIKTRLASNHGACLFHQRTLATIFHRCLLFRTVDSYSLLSGCSTSVWS